MRAFNRSPTHAFPIRRRDFAHTRFCCDLYAAPFMASQKETHLYLHLSNRQEDLANTLARMLRHEAADPLTPQSVVVQSRGMERWLRYQLATHDGIAINLQFPFPRQVVHSLLKVMLGGAEPSPVFEQTNMTWAVYDLLSTLSRENGFEELETYLNDESSLKRYQLAKHLAALFDEAIVYRPDLVVAWTDKDENAKSWQAMLWRKLRALWPGEQCFADLYARLAKMVEDLPSEALDGLPRELRLFGITTLPPAFLDVLTAAATKCQVHFFLLEPTKDYIGDIRSNRESFCSKDAPAPAEPRTPAEVFLGRRSTESRNARPAR